MRISSIPIHPTPRLDLATHEANVRAFMTKSMQAFQLGDETYLKLLSDHTQASLLRDLYPYDGYAMAVYLRDHRKPWLKKPTNFGRLLHKRHMERFSRAVLDLQRYIPSIWFSDLILTPDFDAVRFADMVQMNELLDSIFPAGAAPRMNPYTRQLLCDIFNAACYLDRGGNLSVDGERQIRKHSKAMSNDGFEAALAEFFAALSKLFDMPQVTR